MLDKMKQIYELQKKAKEILKKLFTETVQEVQKRSAASSSADLLKGLSF